MRCAPQCLRHGREWKLQRPEQKCQFPQWNPSIASRSREGSPLLPHASQMGWDREGISRPSLFDCGGRGSDFGLRKKCRTTFCAKPTAEDHWVVAKMGTEQKKRCWSPCPFEGQSNMDWSNTNCTWIPWAEEMFFICEIWKLWNGLPKTWSATRGRWPYCTAAIGWPSFQGEEARKPSWVDRRFRSLRAGEEDCGVYSTWHSSALQADQSDSCSTTTGLTWFDS